MILCIHLFPTIPGIKQIEKKSQQYPTKRVSLISYDQLRINKMGGHRAPNHNDYHQTMTGTFFPRLTSTIDDQWISVRRVIHPSIGLVLFSNHIFFYEWSRASKDPAKDLEGPLRSSVEIREHSPGGAAQVLELSPRGAAQVL